MKFLLSIPWLKHWDQQSIKVLLYQLKPVELIQKQVLYSEGEQPNLMYFAIEGEYKVLVNYVMYIFNAI